MTSIASIIFSDPGIPTAESIPASVTAGEQAFDELLAGLPGGAPAVPMAVVAPPIGFMPDSPIPAAMTPLPELEADALPMPAICVEGAAVAEDGETEPAPEDNVALLSSCLATWQFLPLPGPEPAVVDAVAENFTPTVVPVENLTAPIRTGEPIADRPTVAAVTPVEVQAASPQPPTSAVPRPNDLAAALPHETPVPPAPKETPALPAASTPAPTLTPALAASTPAPALTPAPAPSAPAPAPDGGPVSVALPAVAAPTAAVATNPPPRAILSARVAKAGRAVEPVEIKASRPLDHRSETAPAVGDGIPVAKEQRAMRDLVFHPSPKSAPAAFAEGEIPAAAARETGVGSVPLATSAGESTLQDDRQNEMAGDQREPAAPTFGASRSGGEIDPGVEPGERDAKVAPSEVAQVIQHIERAVERMRSQGGERIEMRVPLQDGGEVVVKIRIEHGEVKAIFQSSADGLQQALETGWSQLGQTPTERIGKAAPAVFESPSMQSGTGGFQQSPDQRERNERGRASEAHFLPPPLPPESKKVNDARRSTAGATSPASLQIYA